LLRLYLNGQIKLDEVKSLAMSNSGWLKVSENEWAIISRG
jgi:hypothetical protein